MSVRAVGAGDVLAVRQAVLRPHQSVNACVYPGDLVPLAAHFAALEGEALVGVASIHPESPEGESDPGAWRLRGMATLARVRGKGCGAAVLSACVDHAREHGASRVWCNARAAAVDFYLRAGFEKIGNEFELPDIGPHYFMRLNL